MLADKVMELADARDLNVLIWDGSGPPPSGIEKATFFVPPYTPGLPRESVIRAMPALQFIQLLTVGYDGWRDLLPRDVVLCNAAGVHGVSTAELAVALLLASSRDLDHYLDKQREKVWRPEPQTGLTERPLLLLGAGDIGQRVAAAVRPLGASVTMVGRHVREGVRGIDELHELLPLHRALVIAVPLTDETRGLIGRAELASLPDGSIVVNVARGPILDLDALLPELMSRRLRAGLDVTDPEPLPSDHPLWDAPNLFITPHVGGGTRDWRDRAARLIADQLARMRSGSALAHVVMRR